MRKPFAILAILAVLALLFLPFLAAAQDGTSPVDYNLHATARVIYSAVSEGDWWTAASAFLVLVVAMVRSYGKKVHELIPDSWWIDNVFWFILDTKPGGWLLNVLTTIAGGLGTAIMAGEAVTWALVKPVLMVSLTGASMWGLLKDIMDWREERKAAPSKEVP